MKRPRGRLANVYDAVAGRVTLNGALSDSETAVSRSKRRLSVTSGRYSSRNPKLAPEEALFKRRNAPVRYAEQDIYWANEDLPDGGRDHLPDTNLLRSVHGYASKFYDATADRLGPRCVVGTRTIDEKSMDETALLAMGILLEEASREVLGKRGDIVFTEASTEPTLAVKAAPVTRSPRPVSEGSRSADEIPRTQNHRKAKRRKVAEGNTAANETT
ncbi:hypothetical protein CHGG_00503 [Chaetomium globosum CBS 148.51]|uniref:Uncharacterized protein n=1 Tax=Chaetomium globosum (strain ATCC 6205 / CBS 148.51 / DSM 1962 / NBRC 6347 / NRRL 1970) TaxID=306901 RepID=Q2HH01_CHAGB|nr:uncharacterized protein CHGG_00503 [Chaetomium globosum CBS 148.51]EAQ92268.1 hypothetical protein CHGG_00503 [Chaetomium globosum CBS 148.51]